MAVTSLSPATTKVATEYNYLNSLSLANGFHKPEQSSEYVQRFGRQDVTGLMELLGNKKTVNNPKFSHYEQERIHGVAKVGVSAAAQTAATVTLNIATASSNYDYTTQSPYAVNSSTTFSNSNISVNDVLEVNGQTLWVKAINGSAITAVPSNGSLGAIAVNDEIIIKGQASPEGSSAPDSRNSRMISYSNYVQIMRRSHKVTGTESATKSWIEVTGKNGERGYFWYLQGIKDEYHRFLNEREAILLTGEDFQNNLAGLSVTGGTSFGDGNSVTFTKGLIPQISADGNVEVVAAGSAAGIGGMTLLDLENMTKSLQKNRGSRENMVYCGHDFKIDFDYMVLQNDFLKNGGVEFASFSGMDQTVSFSIDAIEFGGFKFAPKVLDIFSDPNFLGASNAPYGSMGIVIPMDNTVVYNSMNSSSGVTVPSLQLVSMEGRDYMEWVTGKGMNAATSGDDFFEVHFLSHCGLEVSALNRFGLFV